MWEKGAFYNSSRKRKAAEARLRIAEQCLKSFDGAWNLYQEKLRHAGDSTEPPQVHPPTTPLQGDFVAHGRDNNTGDEVWYKVARLKEDEHGCWAKCVRCGKRGVSLTEAEAPGMLIEIGKLVFRERTRTKKTPVWEIRKENGT